MNLWLMSFDTLDTRTTRWRGYWAEEGDGHCRAWDLDRARTLRSTSGRRHGLAVVSALQTPGQPPICKLLLNRVCSLLINVLPEWAYKDQNTKEWQQSKRSASWACRNLAPGQFVSTAVPHEDFGGDPENCTAQGKQAASPVLCSCLWASVFPDSLPLKKIYLLWVH